LLLPERREPYHSTIPSNLNLTGCTNILHELASLLEQLLGLDGGLIGTWWRSQSQHDVSRNYRVVEGGHSLLVASIEKLLQSLESRLDQARAILGRGLAGVLGLEDILHARVKLLRSSDGLLVHIRILDLLQHLLELLKHLDALLDSVDALVVVVHVPNVVGGHTLKLDVIVVLSQVDGQRGSGAGISRGGSAGALRGGRRTGSARRWCTSTEIHHVAQQLDIALERGGVNAGGGRSLSCRLLALRGNRDSRSCVGVGVSR